MPLARFIPLILVFLLMGFASVYYGRRNGVAGMSGRTIVRCREGHLFTTIWVPFMSFKAIRLGMIRIQRCPVGNHFTYVTPVRESELTEQEKKLASRYQDTNLP